MKMGIKIEMDRDKCIGCGSCTAVCSENWKLAEDGKAKPKKTELEEAGCNKKAAQVCPVKCIEVKEE